MNTEQSRGKWNQVKGRVKKAWGELTNQDMKKAEGSKDKLYGAIQEKVGDTKEIINEKLDKIHLKDTVTNSKKRSTDSERQSDECCG